MNEMWDGVSTCADFISSSGSFGGVSKQTLVALDSSWVDERPSADGVSWNARRPHDHGPNSVGCGPPIGSLFQLDSRSVAAWRTSEPARTCGVAHPPNSYWMPTRRVPEPGSGRPGIGFGGLCLTQGDVTNQRYTRAIRSGTKRGSCPELPIDLDSTMQIVLPTAYLLATSTRDLPSYYQCRTESSMRCAVDE